MMAGRCLPVTALAVAAATCSAVSCAAEQMAPPPPDLAIQFGCRGSTAPPDAAIERFLEGEGFATLNVTRPFSDHGLPTILSLDIVAVDDRHRLIRIVQARDGREIVSAAASAPPATGNVEDLEQALGIIFKDELGCETGPVRRNVSGADAGPAYDAMLEMIDRVFMQAEQIERGPDFATDAPAALSDDAIRAALIGSWTVPKDSSDYREQNALQIYRPDGMVNVYIYLDDSCTTVAQEADVLWSVKDGVLLSVVLGVFVSWDEVVSIEAERMTLHSLDDDTTYVREKSADCSGGSGT
jgi:hypothetical protein